MKQLNQVREVRQAPASLLERFLESLERKLERLAGHAESAADECRSLLKVVVIVVPGMKKTFRLPPSR